MAGDWIKVEHATVDKPEVALFAELLGVKVPEAFGLLVMFWMWCDKNARDGVVTQVSRSSIDTVTHTAGFSAALEVIGWGLFNDAGRTLTLPNFVRHNESSAKSRALAGNRMQRMRDALSVTNASPEKRREEKNKTTPATPPDGFARFWAAWPQHKRKAGRQQCLARWKAKGLEQSSDRVVAHVEAMKRSVDWTKDGGSFIPAPLVYLNQDRFDAPAEVARSAKVAM